MRLAYALQDFAKVSAVTEITADTTLTDRDLLIHLVQHVEHIDEMMTALHDEWEVFRPLIERFRPAGGADFLTILQTGRELRKAAREGRAT